MTRPRKYLRVNFAVTNDKVNPRRKNGSRFIFWSNISLFLIKSKPVAAPMVGMANRKEYLIESTVFNPATRPPTIDMSARLVPGITERD